MATANYRSAARTEPPPPEAQQSLVDGKDAPVAPRSPRILDRSRCAVEPRRPVRGGCAFRRLASGRLPLSKVVGGGFAVVCLRCMRQGGNLMPREKPRVR